MNRLPPTSPARQRGAVLIMYAFLLMIMIGFAGIALDLGVVYFRRAQLQGAADTIALAASKALNGTAAGVAAAVNAARSTAQATRIGLEGSLAWNDAALQFSNSPNAAEGAWLTGDAASAAPGDIMYARVDMRKLEDDMRVIEPTLMRVLGDFDAFDIAPLAVAGPTALRITPLAVCALSNDVAATRTNPARAGVAAVDELVTYGFRHGVTYNLLKVNPQPGAAKGGYYLVDPFATADLQRSSAMAIGDTNANALVGPAMCAGKVAYTSGLGRLHVRRPATFGLASHLNSRFNIYTDAVCDRAGAPPDRNIKNYSLDTAANAQGVNWQLPAPTTASAKPVENAALPLATVADGTPGQVYAPADYGTLWAFGPARSPNGAALQRAQWPALYPTSTTITSPTAWPAAGPYRGTSAFTRTPTLSMWEPAQRQRRVMWIPLLKCLAGAPAAPSLPGMLDTATVLAYGRFLLSAPATASDVPGEFAGVATMAETAQMKAEVELIR